MRIKPYIPILQTLVLNLALLVCRVIRQVILPNQKRKGNLLSSLFILFTGLVEHLIGFGEAISRLPRTVNKLPRTVNKPFALQKTLIPLWTISRKYLRQGMFAAAWILFILSSFEWISPQQPATPATATQQTTAEQSTMATIAKVAPQAVTAEALPQTTPQDSKTPEYYSTHPATCRWLRLCTLRI